MIYKIYKILKEVNYDFPVALSDKVDLMEYTIKLYERANLKVKLVDDEIIGMVAGYIDNCVDKISYISLVAVRKEYRNQKIAKSLIKEFINECMIKKIDMIHLYTDKKNLGAIHLYQSLYFNKYEISNEPSPNDIHLCLKLYYKKEEC